MRLRIAFALLVVALAAAPRPAHAQGVVAGGSVDAVLVNKGTSPGFGGEVTWRFNRAIGLGVELSHVRDIDPRYIYCCNSQGQGRITTFTTNVRVEIPTLATRVIPFVVGGGGVSAFTRAYDVYYLARMSTQLPPEFDSMIYPGPPSLETTTTNMALTLGGGASFLITRHIALDVNMRVLHLVGDETGNIGRFGLGASYRF